ncbi:MAG: 2-oxoacid:acceptor oxidoreductase subunit alpha [Saccharofermentanales bacterium]
MYNLLIGGAAGQGIDTTAAILEKLLKRSGYNVFTIRDFMSRIRGGHNFSLLRFGNEEIRSHSYILDGIIALDDETVIQHSHELNETGFILCDSRLITADPRAIKIDMEKIAKDLGNPRAAGSVAIGAILKLFGESLDYVGDILKSFLREEFLAMNVEAVKKGYDIANNKYPRMNGDFSDYMIITGNKALSLGAIAAGLRFYSAYPMSPSTSIMEFLASKADEANIVVEQAEDEIAAINMAIGASYAGARAMTGTSGGGFSLMVEALGLSGMTETPLVIVEAQRPGPVTGLPTRTEQSDLRFVISASQGEFPRMVISLRNHEDAFFQTIRAFDLAERYQMPVILLSDQYLADASATVKPFSEDDMKAIPAGSPDESSGGSATENAGVYLRYRYTDDGISPRKIPGKSNDLVIVDSDEHDERGWITESAEVRRNMVDKRMRKLEKLRQELIEPEFLGNEPFDTLIVGWGSTYGPISEAVKSLNARDGQRYAALVFGDISPLPTKLLIEKAGQAKQIINVEQNSTGQLKSLIREETGILCTDSILKYDGRQISGGEIAGWFIRRATK